MIKKFLRLAYIFYIINKYCLLNEPIKIIKMKILKVFIFLNPFYYSKKINSLSYGIRIREALEKLGPIFIKFGQALSIRNDLLPLDIIEEISKLQDSTMPFDAKIAIDQIQKSIKKPMNEIFKNFSNTPLASASIAQVHSATLRNNEEVVVKILRPGIDKIIKLDTSLMLIFVNIISKIKIIKKLKLIEIVKEINQSFFDEINLIREAANASQIRRNFKKSNIHYIPKIYWEYTTSNIIVMEKVSGIKISDIKTLDELGVDRHLLAKRGIEICYSQIFNNCFFHADMHPGNMFIDASNPYDPKYISIDFGIVGSLNKEDQKYLAGNFSAFLKRDYRKVAELHIESNWVPSNTRVDILESAIRTVCEPIFEKPIKEISLGYTLMQLFIVARRFNMNIQPQLTLLQKTLFHLEGLGHKLYPELNIWKASRPILKKWMKEQIGLKGLYCRSIKNIPKISNQLPELPNIVFNILREIKINLKNNNLSIDNNYKKSKKKYQYILFCGIILIALGTISSINKNINLIIKLQCFINNKSTILIIIGILCLIYYNLKRRNKC